MVSSPITLTSLATELASLAGTSLGNSATSVLLNAADSAIQNRVQSIAEKARRSIMMYKVLLSAGIRDSDLAGHITKYFENMYAIFTLITLGYNPMAKSNGGIGSIIESVSAESFNENSFGAEIQKKTFSVEMMYLADEVANGNGPRIGKNFKSTEAKGNNYNTNYNNRGNGDQYNGKDNNIYSTKHGDVYQTSSGDIVINEADPTTNSNDKVKELKFIDNVAKNNLRAYPTIVQMNINCGKSTVSIPLAIKANAYPIGSEELRLLIESGISGKALSFLRKIKWRSGEISTMAYILNTDIAERDKKLYEKLGRNPWYVELQKRKTASKTKYWQKIANANPNKYTNDIDSVQKDVATIQGYRGDIPPTSSLVVTTDDLVAATRLNLSHFTKNDGFIKKFMEESFLLAFGIVDLTAQTLTAFFMGYTSPFIVSFDDLKREQSDPNKALYEAIQNLSRKV